MLKANDKAKIARALQQERLARVSKLPTTDVEVRALTEEREPEMEEQAQGDSLIGVLVQLSEKDQRAIEEIDHALACLDEGSYGICETCEDPIPVERLRAMPTTRYCVECKRAQERDLGGRAARIPDVARRAVVLHSMEEAPATEEPFG